MKEYKLRIANAESTNEFYSLFQPFDEEIIALIERADEKAIEQAFLNAQDSYIKVMKNMPAYKRAEILNKVAKKVEKNQEQLAKTISSEGGKPYKDAIKEVQRAVITLKTCAIEAEQVSGEQINMERSPASQNHLAFTIKESIGIVLAISAFNHPLNLICHQVATAFAAGNSVIVKPASQTPISCITLVDYFYEAGLDTEVISVLTLSGSKMQKVVSDSRLAFVSFIGSAEVGWEIQKQVHPGVRLSFEHGGTAVSLVDKSANLENTINSITFGAFYHAGQVCVSTQIVYVHSKVYDKFLYDFKLKVHNLITGDPIKQDTDIGPLISQLEVDRIEEWVSEAESQGAEIFHGGRRFSETCYEPTILTNVTRHMKVWTNEVFGPVVSIIKYNEIEEVISEINRKPFSFQVSVFSQDIDIAMCFAKKANSKACMINDHTAFRTDWMPFGGTKESGLGTGGVKYAINEMMNEKLIIIKNQF